MKLLFISFLFLFTISLTAQEIDTSGIYDDDFQTTADQLTEDLKARLTLTEQQADEIRNILIQYQEKVQFDNHDGTLTEDTIYDPTRTRVDGTETEAEPDLTPDTSFTDNPLSGIDELDVTNDFEKEDNPQKEAGNRIEEVLNQTQRATWSIISDAWWRDVNSRYRWDSNIQD